MDRLYVQQLFAHMPLLERILAFNESLASQDRPLQAPVDAADPFVQMLKHTQAQLVLFKPQPLPFFGFENKRDRLCLLNAEECALLCLYLGASRKSRALSHLVLRKHKEALGQLLGEKVFHFALSTGKLVIQQIDGDLDSHDFTDVKLKDALTALGALSLLPHCSALSHELLQQQLQQQLQALVDQADPSMLAKLCPVADDQESSEADPAHASENTDPHANPQGLTLTPLAGERLFKLIHTLLLQELKWTTFLS